MTYTSKIQANKHYQKILLGQYHSKQGTHYIDKGSD